MEKENRSFAGDNEKAHARRGMGLGLRGDNR